MKKYILLLAVLLCSSLCYAFEGIYGKGETFYFPIVSKGGSGNDPNFETTPVVCEVNDLWISKDGGALVATTNCFVYVGGGIYSITLTATEMQAHRIVIVFRDGTNPPLGEETGFIIEITKYPSNTWYVSTIDGNDTNNVGHSWDDALKTIATAVTAASNGDKIILYPGTYAEKVDLKTATKSLTLEGTDRYGCIISVTDTNNNTYTVDVYNNCALRNLTISCLGEGTSNYGIRLYQASNVLIENCNINGTYDGMNIQQCYRIIVRNCCITGTFDGGYIDQYSYDVKFENDMFIGLGSYTYSTGVCSRGYVFSGGTGVLVKDCIFIGQIPATTTARDCGGAFITGTVTEGLLFDTCIFVGSVPVGATHTGDLFGVGIGKNVPPGQAVSYGNFNNCLMHTTGTSAGTVNADVYGGYAGCKIMLNNCYYNDYTLVSGATLHAVPDSNGAVNVGSINGSWTKGGYLDTLVSTQVPQTGDSYAIVNSGTYGNAKIKTDSNNIFMNLPTYFSVLGITSDGKIKDVNNVTNVSGTVTSLNNLLDTSDPNKFSRKALELGKSIRGKP